MMHRLRNIRVELGWTQRQLAKRAGVAERTIVHIEKRITLPRMETRKAVLKAIGYSIIMHRDIFGPLPQERE